MIYSMTGYGKSVGEINNKKIVVEIKTLNSKQLDVNIRVPNIYREKELEIRGLINQKLERGRVDYTIYTESLGKENSSKINQDVVKSYYEQLQELSRETGIPVTQDWLSILMRLPDTMKTEIEELDEDEWKEILKLTDEALDQVIEFRKQEGDALAKVMTDKINRIGELLMEIEPFENERIEKIKSRLEGNLQTISDKIEYDENRLEQELVYYIEKLDVNEEKVRLKNHLDYFISTMQSEDTVGKKLGFIAQEIGREINTLGSKSNHSEMQKIVVMMKDELEQIKEQILNTL